MKRLLWLALLLAMGAAPVACQPHRKAKPRRATSRPAVRTALPAAKLSSSKPAPRATSPKNRPIQRAMPAGKSSPPKLALGATGAIAAQEGQAAAVGLAVLREGGNAVDAAVAISFALAVTHPSAGNLGGGGFMVIHFADGRKTSIDYREVAPARAHRNMYLDAKGSPTDASLVGALAAGIPGTVAGLALAHKRFGSKPWQRLLAPAIRLAKEGNLLDSYHADDLRYGTRSMLRDRRTKASARYYQHPNGRPFQSGQRWRQPELAETLQAIAQQGKDGFYRGPVAAKLVAGVRKGGGIWQSQDLSGYQAKERTPIMFRYRNHTILSMPPPSSGGVALRQILRARELLGQSTKGGSLAELHHFVESERRAFADRNRLLADMDQVSVPLTQLLSVDYIDARMKTISPDRATRSSSIDAGIKLPKLRRRRPSEETTHFSVVDRHGNAVSTTTTLNTGFGSKFVVPGTGVLLNNEMDDFAAAPGQANAYGLVQGEANAIAPGKRMLSSMTPTVVLDPKGRLRAIVGSPGGPTIISTVAQIVIALVEHNVPIQTAVAAPRIHHQWLPDRVFAENKVSQRIVRGLEKLGHRVQRRGAMGHANCIEVDSATQGFRAVADVARDGGAAVAY